MRKAILMLFVASVAFVGCSDDKPETKNLSIHAQSDFIGDQVVIKVDNEIVLDQEVTTEYSLGVDLTAMRTIEDVPTGIHTIKITVNDSHELTTTVQLQSDLYIAVRYDRELEQISIVQSLQPFMYD